MKPGNIIASLGIVIGVLGLLMLPLYNFHELPFIADTGYAKGGGWKLLAQSGVFKWTGLILLLSGITLFIIAKLLPKKYWDFYKEKVEYKYEIKSGKKRRIKE